MAASSLLVRNAPLFLAALSLGIVAASQGCSPGTLERSEDFKAEADKYGTGVGGSMTPGGTGGKTGSGGAVGTGGGGAVKADAEFYPMGCDIPAILTGGDKSCSQGFCHAGPSSAIAKFFDLKTTPLWSRFLDKDAAHEDGVGGKQAGCPTPPAKLINSANPSESWILKKVNGAQGTCGTDMWLSSGTKDPVAKKCIQDWVMNVAMKGKL